MDKSKKKSSSSKDRKKATPHPEDLNDIKPGNF